MRIEPIFTLQIEDDWYINAETGVNIIAERCVDSYITKTFNGLFKRCNEDGIFLEIGEEESNIIFINFDEIICIEEV